MINQHHISIGKHSIGNDLPMVLIAGPCAIESHDHAIDMASQLNKMATELGVGFIYKSSFDKANRTSIHSHRGLGMDQGLAILDAVKKQIGCPVLTDIHLPEQCEDVAAVVDVMQIPAFLCRQTDLLIAAAKTGKAVNVKKGQFLAPWDMQHVVSKIADAGNSNIMITERGTSFGYNTLVTDMRGLPQMAASGYPVIFDATHSVQQPGGLGGVSGGQRQFVPTLSRAAVAIGVAGLFMETHENPDKAPSDGPNMIPLDQMPNLIKTLLDFDRLAKTHGDSTLSV